MFRRPTSCQRRHTHSWWTDGNMLTIVNYLRNVNQNNSEILSHTCKNQFSSVPQSCSTLCNPMDFSMPGHPVHHQLLELSWWCHPTISSSVVPFSSLLQSFLASGSFQMSQLFTSGGQSIGVSSSTSALTMNIQDWFPLGWTNWISFQSKRTLKSLLPHHSSKASALRRSALYIVQLSHPNMTTGKTIALTRWTFVDKVMSLPFNMLVIAMLVIAFLPRSKRLLNSWLQSPSAVTLEPPKIKSDTVSTVSLSICHEVMGLDTMILAFWMLCFKPMFSLSSFTFFKRLLVLFHFLP